MRRIALIITFVLSFFSASFGQEKQTNWRISGGGFYGFLMSHHPEMLYLPDGHIKGGELRIGKRVDGSKDWHYFFNFPTVGVTLSAADLASPYLGNEYSIRWFIDLPLVKKRWLGLKMDLGAAYIEKPFSDFENNHNSAIGTHLNAALELELYAKVKLSPHFDLNPGLSVQHFSNGAFKMPNSGLNIALAKLSLVYHPYNGVPERKTIPFKPSKWEYFAGTSFGLKEINPINGDKFLIVNIYGQANKRVSNKSSFGGEVGLNFNESLEMRMEELERGSGEKADNYRFYIAGTYQLHFDPMGIRFQVGGYIAPKFTEDSPIFFRYNVYRNFGRLQVFAGLKSHFAKADNIEIGVNYRLF